MVEAKKNNTFTNYCLLGQYMPSSIAKKIWLERSGHDFELLHKSSAQNLKTRPYSKQQVAKNNFTTEPIFFAIPD